MLPESSAVAPARRINAERVFKVLLRQMITFLGDWFFFLVLLRDEMRRFLSFISLDPGYLDCLRANERKLYCGIVLIYNKSTLLNSANLW